jgi:DNA-binding transcriptional MerR regulator
MPAHREPSRSVDPRRAWTSRREKFVTAEGRHWQDCSARSYHHRVNGTYTLTELVHAADTTVRTVRYYLERRALPPAVLRGLHTTYTEDHLIRLKAIRRLRTVERLQLDAIRKRLSAASPEEIRALAEAPSIERPGVPTVAIPPAEGAAPATQANPDLSTGVITRTPGEQVESGGQVWERIELLPGLELHVKKESGALLQRLSREIRERYGVTG